MMETQKHGNKNMLAQHQCSHFCITYIYVIPVLNISLQLFFSDSVMLWGKKKMNKKAMSPLLTL